MDIETTRLLKRGLPLYSALAACLLVLSLAAMLYLGRDVFVPVTLAALLSFVLAPCVRALQRRSVPQGVAVLATVLMAFSVIGLLALVIGGQLAEIGAELPKYQTTIRQKIGALRDVTAGGGTFSRVVEVFDTIGRDLKQVADGGVANGGSKSGSVASPAGRGPIPVVVQEGSGLIGTVGAYVSPLLHPLATTGLVLIFVVFVLSTREDLRNRVVRLLGTDDIQQTTAVIDDAARRLSRLFLMQLAVNAAFGMVIGSGLAVIGMPSPVLWGILAGVLRFVPYIGAVVSAVPPLLLAVAVDPGWSMLIWTLVLFAVLEPLFGHGIEPLLFGHSTGLSPLAVVMAATVWTFLWGPIGLVLATPLTVCIVVLGRHVDRLGFVEILLGDGPPLSPPEIFYQRMLAGDPTEAILQAREFLKERALATYYDEVALEALRLAHEDVARGRLAPERQDTLRRSTDRLIARLDNIRDPRPRGGQVGSEAAAAVLAAGPDRDAATRVLAARDLAPGWRGAVPIVCIARADTLDETIAKMLSQVLTKHGLASAVLGDDGAPIDGEAPPIAAEVRLVFLSYVEPLSTLHLRHAVRVARRHYPGARIMVGIWRERDQTMGQVLGRAARADSVTPTIGAALSAAIESAAPNAA